MNPIIKENLDKYVHVHADCIPVRGTTRSAFCDLTRNEITLFPTAYYDVLEVFKTGKTGKILGKIKTEAHYAYFMEFMEFLIENEFIMFLEDPSMFPPVKTTWDMPCSIQNAIIDVDEVHHDFGKIFESLDILGCEYVQLRTFSDLLKIKDLNNLLSLTYHKSIQRIDILLKYNKSINDEQYAALAENHLIIHNFTIHSAPAEKDITVNFGYDGALSYIIEKTVHFITEEIQSKNHCGIINMKNLSAPSVSNFFENKHYNGCLNRKISVDENGDIRNCPSMPQSYGNIKDILLEEALHKKGFKEVWHINKDQIDICKECEFRYVCTDCRAYLEAPENLYSKPLKCGYDPYTNKWEDWSTHPLKKKAMKYYRM